LVPPLPLGRLSLKNAEKKKDRSQIVLDVKVWEADTDLDQLYKDIAAIKIPSLAWGEAYEKKPVAFGIFKLVITCVIVDDDVPIDDITTQLKQWMKLYNLLIC